MNRVEKRMQESAIMLDLARKRRLANRIYSQETYRLKLSAIGIENAEEFFQELFCAYLERIVAGKTQKKTGEELDDSRIFLQALFAINNFANSAIAKVLRKETHEIEAPVLVYAPCGNIQAERRQEIFFSGFPWELSPIWNFRETREDTQVVENRVYLDVFSADTEILESLVGTQKDEYYFESAEGLYSAIIAQCPLTAIEQDTLAKFLLHNIGSPCKNPSSHKKLAGYYNIDV